MKQIKCPACKTEFLAQKNTCTQCNFPFNGMEQEKAVHIGQFIMKKGVLFDASDNINKSKNILFAISGFIMFSFVISYLFGEPIDLFNLFINSILSLTFFFFAYNIDRSPFLFVLIPLLLILSLYFLNYLIEPKSLIENIHYKLIIVGGLIYTLYLQKSAENFKKKHTNI